MVSPTVLSTLLLQVLTGCRAPGPQPEVRLPVLLVTVDSMRADRLGPYGGTEASTPTLDQLADEGTTWVRAYTHSPLTQPSHASILTGRLPPSHGVRDDGDFRLADDQLTLAERFRAHGWRTLAFTSALPTRARWGFDQGFDLYVDVPPYPARPAGLPDYRRADDVVDDVIEMIETLPDGPPPFVWVHLYDPHWPYDPREPWKTVYHGHPYDAELAFVDANLGRLLEVWDDRYGPDTVVAVTSDHGESLGDDGEQTHGLLLHDATLRVPLILRGPGIEVGARAEDPVGLVDLAPTLLALTGLRKDKALQGRDLRDSGSELVYHESASGRVGLDLTPLVAVTDREGRFVQGAWSSWHRAEGEGFAPGGDPAPLGDPRGAPLQALLEALPVGVADEASLDVRTLERLANLGYVSGDPAERGGPIDPRDAGDLIAQFWRARQRLSVGLELESRRAVGALAGRLGDAPAVLLLEAQSARRRGELPQAADAYAALFARSSAPTWSLQVAGLSVAMGDWDAALQWAVRTLDLDPHCAEAEAIRIRAALRLGLRAEAEDLAIEFSVMHPDHPDQALVRAELDLPDLPDAAIEEATQALASQPGSPWAHLVLGEALWARGDPEEAIAALQQALKLDPFQASVRVRLVRWMLELGRNAEAVRVAAPLARLLPDDPVAQELYERARASVTEDDRYYLRVDRAKTTQRVITPTPKRKKK